MNTLRVLIIDDDPEKCERVATRLEAAEHTVLPLNSWQDACEALEVQRFDAVLLPSRISGGALESFVNKLRQLESRGRSSTRVPILTYAEAEPCTPALDSGIDACLPQDFEPIIFAETVSSLAAGLQGANHRTGEPAMPDFAPPLPIFKAAEFEEQMGQDPELIVELIDLFLVESAGQIIAMHDALKAADYPLLYRIAHTIKGSFGSFYAMQAGAHAQALEQAAKIEDASRCGPLLAAVEADLKTLKPELSRLREARSGS